MWDKAAAERYEAWYATPRGAFALGREQRLLSDIISPWQRRSRNLLEIGCGAGHFLDMFYEGGFDVTGIDKSEAMLEKARDRMGCRVTLRTGDAAHLPFDDGDFDYVAIVTALECFEDPKAALEEAFRVASRGVVIAYLNAWSIYRQEQVIAQAWRSFKYNLAVRKAKRSGVSPPEPDRRRALQEANWFNLLSMWRLVREVSGKRPAAVRSTLFPPSFLWRGYPAFAQSWWQLLPFGAVSVARVDLMPVSATTQIIRTPKMAQAARARAEAVSVNGCSWAEDKRDI